jgi:hypothetical protein
MIWSDPDAISGLETIHSSATAANAGADCQMLERYIMNSTAAFACFPHEIFNSRTAANPYQALDRLIAS